jgi:beta-N-acetylhexosaminidase
MAERGGFLRAAPFGLDQAALDWVLATLDSLTPEERIGQLFDFRLAGADAGEAAALMALKPGGITRAVGRAAADEVRMMDGLRAAARVPLLISADLEGSRMSLPFGTEVPNALALAAVDDLAASRDIAAIMAEEAAAIGINWSFTPVLDINAAFRSAIVATRGFGSDVDRIERQVRAQIEVFQRSGIAATAKHWPGEGQDDRDQHLLTTINPLSRAEWEASHGRLYRAAIAAGVKAVMSAHIALPFHAAEQGAAGVELYRPASVSRGLNVGLLRGELGFNGLIVSDATPMAGLGAWGPYEETLPEVINAGCDVILFAPDPAAAVGFVAAAVAEGRISAARLEEALLRVLGLKASLGLHKGVAASRALPDDGRAARARAVTARAPVLEKDVQGLVPLSVAKHRRVLVVTTGLVIPFAPRPLPLEFAGLLRAEGFEVTEHVAGQGEPPAADGFDLVLMVMAEETLLTRGRIFLDWLKLGGGIGWAMARSWHKVPTALISFGYPYYLYDAPRMPTVVNAFATMPSMQAAVIDGLMGRVPFNRVSPVDAFCGLPDARY